MAATSTAPSAKTLRTWGSASSSFTRLCGISAPTRLLIDGQVVDDRAPGVADGPRGGGRVLGLDDHAGERLIRRALRAVPEEPRPLRSR